MKILLTFLIVSGAYASFDPARLIFDAFKNQCPDIALTNNSALANLEKLSGVLATLRSKESCGKVGALSQFNESTFGNAYSRYAIYLNNKEEKKDLERKIADYTLFLDQNDLNLSALDIELLQSTILSNQTQVLALNSDIVRFEHMSQGIENAASGLISNTNFLFSALNEQRACLDPNSSTFSTLVSGALGIGSLFATPGNALALSMGSSLSQVLGNYLKDAKYLKGMEEADTKMWPDAIRCLTDALSKQYCDMNRAERLFEVMKDDLDRRISDRNAGKTPPKRPRTSLSDGIELLNKDIEGLDEWLVQVYAGSPILSEGDLQDRELPVLQAELLRKIQRWVQPYKRKIDKQLSIADSSQVRDIVYQGIVGLANIIKNPKTLSPSTSEMGGGSDMCYGSDCKPSVENPILVGRSTLLLRFQLLDQEKFKSVPTCMDGDGNPSLCTSLMVYLFQNSDQKMDQGTWEKAYANGLDIINKSLKQVNIEMAQTISFDPRGLFKLAGKKFTKKKNAIQGLGSIVRNSSRILDYLNKVACEEEGLEEDCQVSWYNSYYEDIRDVVKTQELTLKVLALIKEVSNPRSVTEADDVIPTQCRESRDSKGILEEVDLNFEDEKAFIISTCISDLLELSKRGNDIYFSKLREMVSTELNVRFLRGEFETRVEDVLSETRSDLASLILKTHGDFSEVSYGKVIKNITSAKYTTLETGKLFFKTFSKKIEGVINDKSVPKSIRDDLCLRMIPFLDNSKDSRKFIHKVYKSCVSAKEQEYTDGPSVKWTTYIKSYSGGSKVYKYAVRGTSDENFCVYENYLVKNRILRDSVKSKKNE